MKKIQFTVDFGNNKKGDTLNVDVAVAARLVKIRKVAKYFKEKKQPIVEETPESVVESVVEETTKTI